MGRRVHCIVLLLALGYFREHIIFDSENVYWCKVLDVFFTTFIINEYDISSVPLLRYIFLS